MPSARFSAGGANSPRRYANATTYATPEILEATWTAVPQGATGGAIEIRPYPTASPNAGGGFAIPAPAPATAAVAGETFESATYTDRFGNRRWASTPGENAWVDDLLQGVDELPDSPGAMAGRAAGGSLDDVVGQLGGRAGLGLGGVAAGAFSAYGEYQSGGGLASAAAVGVGAGLGSVAGAVVGGVAGSALGPVGTAVGSMIGGAIGQALGAAIGDALIPDANLNGAMQPGGPGSPVLGTVPGADYRVIGSHENRNGDSWRLVTTTIATSPSLIGPVMQSLSRINQAGLAYRIAYVFEGANGVIVSRPQYAQSSEGIVDIRNSSYSLVRVDGGYDPQLYDPNPNKPAFGTPEFRLPNVDLPAPGPGLRRPNLRWPFGAPAPTGEPNPTGDPLLDPTGYPYPDPTGEPAPTGDPTGDPAPYPDPTGQPGADGDDGNDGNDDNEPCDPCAKLDQVIKLLQPAIAGQIDLSPCPVGEEKPEQNILTVTEGAKGLSGISAKIDLALAGVGELWELLRCQTDDEVVLTIPEHWPLRRGAERPQLIVVYRTKERNGSWGNTRYQFSIPWFDHRKRKTLKTSLPRTIRKGEKQASLLLTDNSKMTLFCSTHAEGERVLKSFEMLVVPKFRTKDIRFSDLNGNGKREYKQVTVFPFVAKYYPAGMRDLSPAWTDKLY